MYLSLTRDEVRCGQIRNAYPLGINRPYGIRATPEPPKEWKAVTAGIADIGYGS